MGEGSPPRAGSLRARPAAGLDGTTVPAQAAEVVSSNIVGYQKLSLVNGLNLVAAPFVAVGGETADINETMTSSDMKTGTLANFWNNGSYETLYYYDEDSDGGIYDTDEETCLGPGWGNANQIVVSQDMVRGDGFWIQSSGAAENTFAGEVSTNTVSLTLNDGLNLVGNPFPKDISIQKITSDDLRTGTLANFWNNGSYETVYYYDEDSDGGVYDTDEETCLGPGWGNANQIVVNHTISSGEGFWIQSSGAASASIEF